jgi:hypothetical protein
MPRARRFGVTIMHEGKPLPATFWDEGEPAVQFGPPGPQFIAGEDYRAVWRDDAWQMIERAEGDEPTGSYATAGEAVVDKIGGGDETRDSVNRLAFGYWPRTAPEGAEDEVPGALEDGQRVRAHGREATIVSVPSEPNGVYLVEFEDAPGEDAEAKRSDLEPVEG